jgi:L-iditol 2-dehydrogenase
MKAIRVHVPGSVELAEVDRARPGPGETAVRVVSASICPTDRRLVARGTPVPRIPGHEVAGLLEDGTSVGVHPDIGCGRCRWCLAGMENRCPNRVSIGLERDGGLAEAVVVPDNHLVPLDGVELAVAPFLEPLACVVHAVSLLEPRRGDRAAVVGAGAMGILAMWVLAAEGLEVVVVQRSEPRRRLARRLGASAVLAPEDEPPWGPDEAPGLALVTAPGSEPLAWAGRRVGVGGAIHVFAGTPTGASVDANAVHYRHLRVVGSTGSTLRDYARARELVATGRIPLDRLPTVRVGLERVVEVLTTPPDPGILKVTVDVGGPR